MMRGDFNIRHLIKLCVDGLVVPQDPAQSKQWGFKGFVLCQLLV